MLQKELLLMIDIVVFTIYKHQLCVLVLKRSTTPFADFWALPGTEIDIQQDSSVEDAVKRKLKELTSVEVPYLEQVQTLGNQYRDPRGWSVTINYYSMISGDKMSEILSSKASDLRLMTIKEALSGPLAFDHQQIIESCLQRFQNKSLYTSLPIFLLPTEFTLTELQKTYETVLDFKIEKKSFRRRLLDAGFLEETGNVRRASNRPASLYRLSYPQPYFFARIIEGVRDSKTGLTG